MIFHKILITNSPEISIEIRHYLRLEYSIILIILSLIDFCECKWFMNSSLDLLKYRPDICLRNIEEEKNE